MDASAYSIVTYDSLQTDSIEVLSSPEDLEESFSDTYGPNDNGQLGLVLNKVGDTDLHKEDIITQTSSTSKHSTENSAEEAHSSVHRKPEPKPEPRKPRKVSPYAHCEQERNTHQRRVVNLENKMSKMDLDGLYETPWRKTVNWNIETLTKLKVEMEGYEPLGELLTGEVAFPHVNILMFGGVGAGKSSVFNTVNSVFRAKIFNVARSGCATHSLTTKFTKYPIMSGSSTTPVPLKFRLCDLRGLEPEHLMTKENLRYILDGCIADKFPFDPSGNITSDMPGFNRNPRLEDKIHCVALVQDASAVDAMQDLNPEVTKNIKDMQTVMNSLDIPQVVILTKIDHICEDTKNDVGNAFRSPKVEKCVSKVSEVLGLPRNAIFPMKNYEMEYQLDPAVDILALLTLKGILTNCDAHLFNHFEEIRKTYAVSDKRPCGDVHKP